MGKLKSGVKNKKNYRLLFNADFEEDHLNSKHWIPYYLPHWSSREKSAAQFSIKDGFLSLQITKTQQPWCPEFNGKVKCSSLQTGLYAAEPGSSIGQHKFFNRKAVVREQQENVKKYVPQYGYFEMRAKFAASRSGVVALWMIGYEDSPERSGELCIMEIKGWNVKKNKSNIGLGIRSFNDPKLVDEFSEDEYEIDVTQFHVYAAEWTEDSIAFSIDNTIVKKIHQSPTYPMQLMLGIYEIPDQIKHKAEKDYPKEFVVDYVRGYALVKNLKSAGPVPATKNVTEKPGPTPLRL